MATIQLLGLLGAFVLVLAGGVGGIYWFNARRDEGKALAARQLGKIL